MTERKQLDLETQFFQSVECQLDAAGIYPFPGMSLSQDGQMEFAMITDADLCFRWFWEQTTKPETTEAIFGIDRTTRPGQGTEFGDVLTCIQWKRKTEVDDSWEYRVGVINYQVDPRIVRPWDWDNEFWRSRMLQELKGFCPIGNVPVELLRRGV